MSNHLWCTGMTTKVTSWRLPYNNFNVEVSLERIQWWQTVSIFHIITTLPTGDSSLTQPAHWFAMMRASLRHPNSNVKIACAAEGPWSLLRMKDKNQEKRTHWKPIQNILRFPTMPSIFLLKFHTFVKNTKLKTGISCYLWWRFLHSSESRDSLCTQPLLHSGTRQSLKLL